MWWEAVPSFAVVMAAIGLCPVVIYAGNLFKYGNPYRRQVHCISDAQFYLRDMRISGIDNAYFQKGLDYLDPEPEQKSETKSEQKPECR